MNAASVPIVIVPPEQRPAGGRTAAAILSIVAAWATTCAGARATKLSVASFFSAFSISPVTRVSSLARRSFSAATSPRSRTARP